MTLHPDPLPLRQDADGNVYVGASRVLLETILRWFKEGTSPEEIARNYDTISQADVYAVIAYYLRHRTEVDEYLREQQEEGDRVRQEIAAANAPRLAQLKAKMDAARTQRDAERAAVTDG